jgi:hypothetical protein
MNTFRKISKIIFKNKKGETKEQTFLAQTPLLMLFYKFKKPKKRAQSQITPKECLVLRGKEAAV